MDGTHVACPKLCTTRILLLAKLSEENFFGVDHDKSTDSDRRSQHLRATSQPRLPLRNTLRGYRGLKCRHCRHCDTATRVRPAAPTAGYKAASASASTSARVARTTLRCLARRLLVVRAPPRCGPGDRPPRRPLLLGGWRSRRCSSVRSSQFGHAAPTSTEATYRFGCR